MTATGGVDADVWPELRERFLVGLDQKYSQPRKRSFPKNHIGGIYRFRPGSRPPAAFHTASRTPSRISCHFAFNKPGRDTNATSIPLGKTFFCIRKAARSRRRIRFLSTAFPSFLPETAATRETARLFFWVRAATTPEDPRLPFSNNALTPAWPQRRSDLGKFSTIWPLSKQTNNCASDGDKVKVILGFARFSGISDSAYCSNSLLAE